MSNRQARREQSRTLRTQRAGAGGSRGGRRPAGGGTPRRPGDRPWYLQPFTLLVGVVAIAAVVALGIVIALDDDAKSADVVTKLEEARRDLPLELANGNKLGRDDAPLKLTAFEDFQCPFCLRYTAEQEPTLVEEYVKTGKVQIIYEHYAAVGKESNFAAKASACAADQNKFWEYHNALFLMQAREGQHERERIDVGRLAPDKLKGIAKEVGVPDQAKFEQCYDSDQHADDVTNQLRKAKSLGITGTPGFLFNGVPIGGAGAPATLDSWRELLNGAIDGITKPAATGTPAASPTTAATATATRAP